MSKILIIATLCAFAHALPAHEHMCFHKIHAEDHKCYEACSADGPFVTKGIETRGMCSHLFQTLDSDKVVLQCPDGVTNIKYCAATAINVTITTKGEPTILGALQSDPASCDRAINVPVKVPTTWGGYYDKQSVMTRYPNRRKHFPDAHVQTWQNAGWDCKGNDQGGCNGDRDQWVTLGCDFCVAEEKAAAADKWAIWHTVGSPDSNCTGFPSKTGRRENCEQDTLPRDGFVQLIATYDDRYLWSPKVWTSYSNSSLTAKGSPICCHPVCKTDPGCANVTWPCGAFFGGCCSGSPFQGCHYDGHHDECDK